MECCSNVVFECWVEYCSNVVFECWVEYCSNVVFNLGWVLQQIQVLVLHFVWVEGSISIFIISWCDYISIYVFYNYNLRHATFSWISWFHLFLVSVLPFKIETTIQNHWNCVISSFFWVKLQLRACESLTTGSFQNQHYHVLKKRYSHSVTANISLWIFIQLWDCVELFVCELARVTLPSKRESVCLFE